MAELEWNVYVGEYNSGEIEQYNIFHHGRFMDDLRKEAKKHKDSEREDFEERMRRLLMYYFWSKCEWEVVIDHWPQREDKDRWKPRHIDVYEQVWQNWIPFCDYVWARRAVLRRRNRRAGEG